MEFEWCQLLSRKIEFFASNKNRMQPSAFHSKNYNLRKCPQWFIHSVYYSTTIIEARIRKFLTVHRCVIRNISPHPKSVLWIWGEKCKQIDNSSDTNSMNENYHKICTRNAEITSIMKPPEKYMYFKESLKEYLCNITWIVLPTTAQKVM